MKLFASRVTALPLLVTIFIIRAAPTASQQNATDQCMAGMEEMWKPESAIAVDFESFMYAAAESNCVIEGYEDQFPEGDKSVCLINILGPSQNPTGMSHTMDFAGFFTGSLSDSSFERYTTSCKGAGGMMCSFSYDLDLTVYGEGSSFKISQGICNLPTCLPEGCSTEAAMLVAESFALEEATTSRRLRRVLASKVTAITSNNHVRKLAEIGEDLCSDLPQEELSMFGVDKVTCFFNVRSYSCKAEEIPDTECIGASSSMRSYVMGIQAAVVTLGFLIVA